ncbi:MAG: molybdopterin-dependent oxidoreductase [Deltaproteobacteria bacterium]|nr:molybdopterin-dependent oxidoreductase [Deltaproteobacteria bacterium]
MALPALTRRAFLITAGTATLSLTLGQLRHRPAPGGVAAASAAAPSNAYTSFEDLYRSQWRWDRVAAGTHLRVNCISACAFDLYVKDDVVLREEQAAIYDQSAPDVPDFNPRGCNKGACYSELMYAPSRIKYPLMRVGERGAGKWKRISWDEALDRLADAIVSNAVEHGPESIVYDHGTTNIDFGPGTGAELRLFSLLRSTMLDSWAGVGDMPMGAVQTWGMFNVEGTSDDWFRSDYIVVWAGNPVVTRIPEAHFLHEARYRGAQLVIVAPDYSQSAIHSDLWVPVSPGADAALAMACAGVILAEGLHDEDYIREQTDLAFLVREDTGRFLREADRKAGGAEDRFYFFDEVSGEIVEAPGTQGRPRGKLALKAWRPALSGRREARLADGRAVGVVPVLDLLRKELERHAPEQAAAETGVSPQVIRKLARDMARAPASMIIASWGACKHYHSDLAMRAMILLMALTGNQGKPGGGLRTAAWWSLAGFEEFAAAKEQGLFEKWAMKIIGRPPVRVAEEFYTKETRTRMLTPSSLWLYVHGGLDKVAGKPELGDPTQGVSLDKAVATALDKGWMPVFPAPGKDPKVFIFTGPNPLRRWPAPQVIKETLWPKFDLIASVNFRMSTTTLLSDLVLPAAGYYEKIGIKYTMSYVPYVIFGDQAVKPLHESRDEWDIVASLAKRIQNRAQAAGLKPLEAPQGEPCDLGRVYDQWSENGRFKEGDPVSGMQYILDRSDVTAGLTWEEARKRRAVPIKSAGPYAPVNAIGTTVSGPGPVAPSQWFVAEKEPWPTLTGRQQFYIDHPWYMRAGEALPTAKPAPPTGGAHPFILSGGHTRWSVHTMWRDQRHMLRLQRGEPVIYMNPGDAAKRGIGEHGRARVANDIGAFEIRVKLSPAIRPGQLFIYHAWEPYQFAGWHGPHEPIASPWKPIHLVGDYGQLHYRMYYAAPGFHPRGTTVDIHPA